MQEHSITAFFPAYNDARTIGDLVRSVDGTLRSLTADYEIVVVDDGSQDETPAVLASLSSEVPRLRVVRHAQNRGYGGALRSGFASASKDLVFYTDGDGQYDPTELRLLLDALDASTAMVQGYKRKRHDPLHRVALGRLYHHVVRFAFGLQVRDVDCDFRLLRREVFGRVSLQCDSGAICVELVKKLQDARFRIREVPVTHYPRVHGRSQFFTIPRLSRTCLDLSRLLISVAASW